MATIRTDPPPTNLIARAGDTLTIEVRALESLIGGRVWSAQVRATHDAATVDADFLVTPPTEVDGPAFLVLSAADTALLGGGYEGVWDVQLAPPGGGDPTTTLAGGALTLNPDVTRP